MSRLLIIDDELPYSHAIKVEAEPLGWTVDATALLADGLLMIERAQEAGKPYDAILLDLGLRDSIRFETLARLREIRRKTKGARLVINSGWMPPGEIPDGVCDAVLEKISKFRADDVLAAISKPAS